MVELGSECNYIRLQQTMFSEESKLEVDIVLALSATCQVVYLVIYSLYVVLKYLCLLLYYSLIDGIWAMLSNELLIKQSITGSQALICGAGGEIGRRLALKVNIRIVNAVLFYF